MRGGRMKAKAQVLPFPVRPPMGTERYEALKAILDQRISELKTDIKETKIYRDRVKNIQDQRHDEQLQEQRIQWLAKFEGARSRLTLSLDYGNCKTCYQEIEVDRLRALPLTELCKICESQKAHEGSARLAEDETRRQFKRHIRKIREKRRKR